MPGPNSADTERGPSGRPPGGEFAAISQLASGLKAVLGGPPGGETWIGDDAAVLAPPAGQLLLTTDVSVAGVHADLSLVSIADLGWRALAASVSDIAAMGGRPRHAVVAVAGPPDTDLAGLYDGLAAAAAAWACPVVGGDLSAADRLSVAVAVTGDVPDAPGAVLRSGARPGERIFVTGPLGAAAAGLRLLRGGARRPSAIGARGKEAAALLDAYRRPQARPAEGAAARRAGATAMVDVSDGLVADLGHVADASGVGFRLDDVPVHPGAQLEDALGGGEDYELVVVAPDAAALTGSFERAGLRPPRPIGQCVEDPAERTLRGQRLLQVGWTHHFHVPDASSHPRCGGLPLAEGDR